MVEAFAARDPGIAARFNETMKKAVTAAQLGAAAEQLAVKGGGWKGAGEARAEKRGALVSVTVRGDYERLAVDFLVSFDAAGKVAGFYITKMESTVPWALPPYAKAESYREEPARVDAGGWPLPATLSLPRREGRLPALVLVHGSGPNDRDETVGPNKVFGDLAAGLASRGIIVLRYEKRTKEYSARLVAERVAIDADSETIDDAVAALGLLSRDPRVDRGRIFLAGHSQGGMLGPRIAEKARAAGIPLAGLVLLAPNARPLEDLIVDQVRYLSLLDGKVAPEEEKAIADLRQAAARVKGLGPAAPAVAAADLPLGIPESWWLSVAGYDPVARARALGLPLLVIHGGRDYQATGIEAELWKKGLAGLAGARCLVLPGLNHLLMKGSGPSSPAEYEGPGQHVDEGVVKEMAGFVDRTGR